MNDDVFDQISRLLPAESSLSRSEAPTPQPQPHSQSQRSNNLAAAVAAFAAPPTPVSAPQTSPVGAMANMALSQNPTSQPAPPAYHQTGPPTLPARGGGAPPPAKPVLAHARALYRYQAADERDLSFERDDRVAIHEYMNDDWWMGRNERTGAEGIFPKNYVQVDQEQNKQQQPPQPYGGVPQQQYGGYYPPAGAAAAPGGYPAHPAQGHNPYNANAPPMAVAQGGGGSGGDGSAGHEGGGNNKMNEHGKKFGKKLGNADIFGAGATMGSNLVNSIF